MRPVPFCESNGTLTAPVGMKDCGDLPVHRDGAHCISCWQLSAAERLRLLFTGRVWLWVFAGSTHPPIAIEARFPFVKANARDGDKSRTKAGA